MVIRPRAFMLFCLLIGPRLAFAQEPMAQLPAVYASPAPTSEGLALTLAECFALALTRSETIAIQQELIKETEARFSQALSGILPRASFEWSEKRQDGSGGSAFTLKEVPERKFVFSQPLFSGFKEFAAMAGSRAERRQRRFERTRAEHLLLVDVSNAFYLLLEQQEDRQALETIRTALLQRIDELKERERLGRSRLSEIASAQAKLRRVEADLEQILGRETTARHLLEFLTGLERVEALSDRGTLPASGEEREWLSRLEFRPDLQAAEEAWRVAAKAVVIARADWFPDVNVEGNYYIKRVGAASGVDWDVLLTVDVPIFQGGRVTGAVNEATSRERQARLRLEQIRRQALLEIRDAYANYQAGFARHAVLEQARDAAEENYRLQVEDYRLNLVNNLDVLQALEDVQNARRETIHAIHEVKRLSWQLRVAAGNLP
ncbi:MAG: TolC family protein [Candidatus Omnitrophica bacterium]|nr:TolC family protein [Candidatus Omnitrophota bacterium]